MTNKLAIIVGLFWSVFMILTMEVLIPYSRNEQIFPIKWIAVIIWIFLGLAFGFGMKYLAIKKEKRNQSSD